MKKNEEDKLSKNNVVDGNKGPKIREKSSNIPDSEQNIREHGIYNESGNIQSTDDSNMSSSDFDNINDNLNENGADDSNSNQNDVDSVDSTSEDDGPNCCNLDLAVLNEISRTCQLAMNNISYLTNTINSLTMKKDLVAIYSQYSNVLFQVNQHFEKYGEVPDCISLGCKVMGFCGVKMNTIKDKSNSHVADIMIQGTLLGIIKCQKILNNQLDIDKSTTKLLKDFNKFQRENIDKLNAYL